MYVYNICVYIPIRIHIYIYIYIRMVRRTVRLARNFQYVEVHGTSSRCRSVTAVIIPSPGWAHGCLLRSRRACSSGSCATASALGREDDAILISISKYTQTAIQYIRNHVCICIKYDSVWRVSRVGLLMWQRYASLLTYIGYLRMSMNMFDRPHTIGRPPAAPRRSSAARPPLGNQLWMIEHVHQHYQICNIRK